MILIGVSLLVLALDQVTKYLVLHHLELGRPVPLLSDYVCLTYTQNPGTAFGLLGDLNPLWRIPFFGAITLLAGGIVFWFQRAAPADRVLLRAALGLVWGGALGNLADRLFYGQVVDFIDVGFHQYRWYVFNLADSCITVGLALLLADHLRRRRGA